MIQHGAEVLAVLAVAFAVGSVIGWLLYRLVDRTDYAFDQRDLSDAIGRLFGVRTPPPVEEQAGRSVTTAVSIPVQPAVARPRPIEAAAPRPEPVEWPESPIVAALPDVSSGVSDPFRLEPAAKSEAAEELRKRVQASSRAAAWREARDERLRPGESAAQLIAGPPPPEHSPKSDVAAKDPPPADQKPPHDTSRAPSAEPSRSKQGSEPADHDEAWDAAPKVWPVDLRSLPAVVDGRPPLAPPAPVHSEITLVLAPVVAAAPLVADDIWSDEPEETPEPGAPVIAPPAADRPPAAEIPPGERDNLRRIKGIGQGFEKRLNQLGVYRYAQIAAWSAREQAWISAELGFPGRVERDDWAGQASRLSRGPDVRAGSQAEI